VSSQLSDSILSYVKSKRDEGKWQKAMEDILYFIEHYVPKKLFNLKIASPQQLDMLQAVMGGTRYIIIRAPRKGGKTILVAIIAVWLVLRDQTYRVFILSGSQNQAEWLYEYCADILEPDDPVLAEFLSQFLIGGVAKSKTRFKLGGWIMYAPASEKQVNAPTADCIIMDEYVLIPTNIVYEAWPMIRGSTNPMRFLLSTSTAGKANTESFLDMLDEPGGYDFTKFEWESKDCPFLQTEVALRDANIARRILTEDMFITQYIGGNPKRAGRIFMRTQIREAFVAPDPDKPGFLKDGAPGGIPFELDPEKRISRGEAKGGIDWGFDHDTAIIMGYRELGGRLVLTRMIVGSGTSASEYGDLLMGTGEADSEPGLAHKLNVNDWFADAAGAFQNQELKNRGLRVVSRAFQHQTRGKEWMIGITQWYLRQRKLIIPDIEEFALLKDQMKRWRRDVKGKAKKGYDHCNDGLLCFCSGYNPTYYDTTDLHKVAAYDPRELQVNKWSNFNSSPRQWMPKNWADRKEELTRDPWKK